MGKRLSGGHGGGWPGRGPGPRAKFWGGELFFGRLEFREGCGGEGQSGEAEFGVMGLKNSDVGGDGEGSFDSGFHEVPVFQAS